MEKAAAAVKKHRGIAALVHGIDGRDDRKREGDKGEDPDRHEPRKYPLIQVLQFVRLWDVKAPRLPSLSGKERIVLELLVSSGAKYGLQLVDESRGRLKRGTVYVTLGRMEQKGLIESRHEPQTRDADALTRRMYHATGYGRRVLDAWSVMARTLALEPGR